MAIFGVFPFADYFHLALMGREGARGVTANQESSATPSTSDAAEGEGSQQDRVTISETAKKLSEEEKKELQEMKEREQEVMSHEQAHQAAGGQYASAPSYSYQRGPDGAAYVSDGEVSIDLSQIPNDPQATIQKANQVRAAALAPANPSPQDLRVAAEAVQMASEAQRELNKQQQEASSSKTEESASPSPYSNPPPANDDSNSQKVARNPYSRIANTWSEENIRHSVSLTA
ncbi:MAG: hypothetical protein G8345_07895 [Magnetococcales bacterium]|nr:hypothetical protein [Magnetococcales bacterium]NGZ26796.1 hypothetical protein [Magnetococcales bacterium]